MTLNAGLNAAAAGCQGPARSAAAGLERAASSSSGGGGASTSGRPVLAGWLPSSRQLWAAGPVPGSRQHRRQGRVALAISSAAQPWQQRQPGMAAGMYTQPLPAAFAADGSAASAAAPLSAPRSLPQTTSYKRYRQSGSNYAASPPPAAAAAAAMQGVAVSVEGTVQKITYRSADTAYTVLRLQLAATPVPAAAAAAAGAGDASAAGAAATAGVASAAGAAAAGAGRPLAAVPAANGKRKVITVVGTLPQVAIGQSLRFRGSWVQHKQYGHQLLATDLDELAPSSDGEMVAYLGGGAIPGVGPVTARRMVEQWGTGIEEKLNSVDAVRYLEQCGGIGHSKAANIKQAWDASKGTREGVAFLKEHAIPLPLAQRIAERWGPHTVERVRVDPYAALAGFGLPFSKVDLLASKVGAPPNLVSRAAMALQQCLTAAAAEEGHTYLPWDRLEKDCGRLLREVALHHAAPWEHPQALYLVGQHMHNSGTLVAEPPPAAAPAAEAPAAGAADGAAVDSGSAAAVLPAVDGAAGWVQGQALAGKAAEAAPLLLPGTANSSGDNGSAGSSLPSQAVAAAPLRAHPSFDGIAELKSYLGSKLKGIKPATIDSLLSGYGEGVLAVLDSHYLEAVEKLSACRKVGPKTSEKIKLIWEAAHGNTALAPTLANRGAAAAGVSGRPGLTMAQLLDAPPAVGFAWGPATRCYSPHLHAAEQTVAQCSLQRAGMYKPATTRQLNRVRKWVAALAANQAKTDIQMNEGQARAIEAASDAPLMVLTGGPGCGKTTAVQTIVKLWCAQNKMVRIAAPTGRAAQRMGEIQGIEPCTIHRLLGYQPRKSTGGGDASGSGGGGGGLVDLDAATEEARLGTQGAFQYHRGNPLPADAVLVDEASMLSLPLAAALIDALRPRCQLVLVGDVDQLPPVGPGAVLHSLIASRLLPVVDLREIFRQAAESAIITSALAVRRGDVPVLQAVAPTAAGLESATSDALLVRAQGSEDLAAAVKGTVAAMRQAHGYLSGGDEEADLQVISPMRKGPAGTAVLNPMLQALLNPPRPDKAELPRHHSAAAAAAAAAQAGGDASAAGGSPAEAAAAAAAQAGKVFRQGDRVIQLVNNYDKEVFNGDQGRVVSCSPSTRQLVVHFPHLDKSSDGSGGEQSSCRTYQGVELSQLELAYAITVHKAQGGEAQHVVLALSQQQGRMLTRRLLYTGLTRAKRQLVVVSAGGGGGAGGDPLTRAVRRKEGEARLTSLQARLEEGRAAGGLPELAVQSYNNEEQMLQQAAQWQQQQQQQQQQAAVGQPGWQHQLLPPPQSHQSWQQQGEQQEQQQASAHAQSHAERPPLSPAQLAAAAEQLQQLQGLPAPEAAALVTELHQVCPQALLDVPAVLARLTWLQQQSQLSTGLTLDRLVRRAPLLLEVDAGRLQTAMRFLEAQLKKGMDLDKLWSMQQQQQQPHQQQQQVAAGGRSSSLVESLGCLWASAAAAQQAAQQQHVQQQINGEQASQQQQEQQEAVAAASMGGGGG